MTIAFLLVVLVWPTDTVLLKPKRVPAAVLDAVLKLENNLETKPLSSSKYMLFTGREVRIGKNCARGLEYGPRPQAEGRTQDRGHSFPYTDRPRPVNNVFIFSAILEVERGELV